MTTDSFSHRDNDLSLQWRHNERDGVSNHQPRDCLLNCLFRHRSKKTSELRVTGLCAVNSPHKGPVTPKMFPFDDVIMIWNLFNEWSHTHGQNRVKISYICIRKWRYHVTLLHTLKRKDRQVDCPRTVMNLILHDDDSGTPSDYPGSQLECQLKVL